MFIPKAKDLQIISKQKHREKHLRLLFNSNKPTQNDFVKEFKAALTSIILKIKNTVATSQNQYVYYFYNGKNQERRKQILTTLTKTFSAKGYTVKEENNHLKIMW